jgi:flagellar biosynthesis protein FlhA
MGKDGVLPLITLAPALEDLIMKGIQKTEHGSYLSLDPKVADAVIDAIKKEAEKAMAKSYQPVLLTSPAVRRHLRKMIEFFIPTTMVLSHSELLNDMKFRSIGEVTLSHGS